MFFHADPTANPSKAVAARGSLFTSVRMVADGTFFHMAATLMCSGISLCGHQQLLSYPESAGGISGPAQ